jgi:hypothetical protein
MPPSFPLSYKILFIKTIIKSKNILGSGKGRGRKGMERESGYEGMLLCYAAMIRRGE